MVKFLLQFLLKYLLQLSYATCLLNILPVVRICPGKRSYVVLALKNYLSFIKTEEIVARSKVFCKTINDKLIREC